MTLAADTSWNFWQWGRKLTVKKMMDGEQRIKCKGISKKEQLKAKLNMDVMKSMIFGTGPTTVEACNDLRFKRNLSQPTIESTLLKRHISCTQTSRVIGRSFKTYPHGYKVIPFLEHPSESFAVILNLMQRFNPAVLKEVLLANLPKSLIGSIPSSHARNDGKLKREMRIGLCENVNVKLGQVVEPIVIRRCTAVFKYLFGYLINHEYVASLRIVRKGCQRISTDHSCGSLTEGKKSKAFYMLMNSVNRKVLEGLFERVLYEYLGDKSRVCSCVLYYKCLTIWRPLMKKQFLQEIIPRG